MRLIGQRHTSALASVMQDLHKQLYTPESGVSVFFLGILATLHHILVRTFRVFPRVKVSYSSAFVLFCLDQHGYTLKPKHEEIFLSPLCNGFVILSDILCGTASVLAANFSHSLVTAS